MNNLATIQLFLGGCRSFAPPTTTAGLSATTGRAPATSVFAAIANPDCAHFENQAYLINLHHYPGYPATQEPKHLKELNKYVYTVP
jgi:hypothetical protein